MQLPMVTDNGAVHLSMHELTTLFPSMTEEEYTGFKADVALNGIHQPIAVWQGQIIDGRHRYQVCQELGIQPPLHYLDDDADPVSYILSENMSRRNMNPGQRAIVMAMLPKIGLGGDRHSHAFETARFSLKTQFERAQVAQVNEATIQKADTVFNYGGQEVVERVRLGQIYLDDAYNAVRAARVAQQQANKAERARIAAEKAEAAEREAVEKARAEREAAEQKARAERAAAAAAEREAVEKARAEQKAAAAAEREAVEKARAERAAAEQKARAERAAAAAAEREAVKRARAEREAAEQKARAERAAAAAAARAAVEKARVEREANLLAAAQQQMDDDPTVKKLTAAVREQHRLEARAAAQVAREPVPGVNNFSEGMPVGQYSRVIFVDNLDPVRGIHSLPDERVALTFTSPPYWNFVDYGHEDSGVGSESSYREYIDTLQRVFVAVWQKTIPGGRVVVNVSNMKSRQDVEGESFIYPIVADTIKIMSEAGFTFFDEIIWHKGSANAGALSGTPLWGSYPYPPTPKILDSTFENILVFTKPGHRNVDLGIKELSRLTVDDWREYTRGVWTLPADRDPNHPATFPMEVADRIVRMYSFVNDLVVDPFAGSGTTVISAEKNGRTGTGYEISPLYAKAVKEKSERWLSS